MFLAALLALSFIITLPSVLAQDLASLPPCAVTCIKQEASDCALTTPQCLCPHQQDIDSCIAQTCPISDTQDSLHAIESFCQSTSSTSSPSTTQTPPRPAPTTSRPPTHPTPNPGTTHITVPLSPQQSTTTAAASTLTSTSTTLSSASNTTSSTISLPPSTTPPPSLSSDPVQGSQTIVVFSTQFASPAPPTGNTSGTSSPSVSILHHLIAPLLFITFFLI